MIILAMAMDDRSVPSCSFSFPETRRLEVPRKDSYYVQDVAVQADRLFSPKLRIIAHRLAFLCSEFDKEFFTATNEPEQPDSMIYSLLKWIF